MATVELLQLQLRLMLLLMAILAMKSPLHWRRCLRR